MLAGAADDDPVFHIRNLRGAPKIRRTALQSPDEPAEQEENDRADRGDADGAEIELSRPPRSPSKETGSQPATDEGADDAEEDGDDTTGRVPPWHEEIRQCPGDKAEQNPIEPERQTLPLLAVFTALRNARRAIPGRHPVDPEENERTDDGEDD